MENKVGRNDPCPCGSGKKYKQCCMLKQMPAGKKKFTASVIKQAPKKIDLMERTYGAAIARTKGEEAAAIPPPPPGVQEGQEDHLKL